MDSMSSSSAKRGAEAAHPEVTADTPSTDGAARAELEAIAEASVKASGRDARPPPVQLAPGTLGVAKILRVEAGVAEIDFAGSPREAFIEATVHPSVIETAMDRGENVLVTSGADGVFRIIGAVRTQPTPGVDAMDEIKLKANRIELEADQEVQVRSGVAIIAVRAVGEVETYAERIVSRAEELQKIVARMLRLN
jgi:hypothetical protein